VPRITVGELWLLELPVLRNDGLGREPPLLLLPLLLRGTAVPRDVALG
jgi:hypothetical protein